MKRSIPQMPAYLAWATQAPQYKRPDITDRSPGTNCWRVPPRLVDGLVIDCLLHYDEAGLVGILNHTPNGSPKMGRPGDIIWWCIRPSSAEASAQHSFRKHGGAGTSTSRPSAYRRMAQR